MTLVIGSGTLTRRIAAVSAIAMSIVIATCARSSTAQPAPSPTAPAALALQSLAPADLDAFIARTVADQRAIGVTVGVMQDGKVVFSKGYGLANISNKTPVSTNTIFAVGSITKQFTCAVALQMEQEGKLKFDDRVSRYRADFGHAYRGVLPMYALWALLARRTPGTS